MSNNTNLKTSKNPFYDIGISDFAINLGNKFNKHELVVEELTVQFDGMMISENFENFAYEMKLVGIWEIHLMP